MLTFIRSLDDRFGYVVIDELGRQRNHRYAHDRGMSAIASVGQPSPSAKLGDRLAERPPAKDARGHRDRIPMNQASGRVEDYIY